MLIVLLVSGRTSATNLRVPETPVDWPAFMQQHDMVFDDLPRDWTEAPHFGNAMVGSMLYRAGNTIRLQVFRADVHDHRDDSHGWTAYSRPRLMIGYFSLHPIGQLAGCMVDTAGIWFQGGSWPYFTTDWNIQAAHWPVYAANRLEQGQALVDRLHKRREELIQAVRPVAWQEDSAYLPLAVAWDMRGSRDGDMRYFDLVGNLPWAMHDLWMQYRYSMDEGMLREKACPLLRRSMNLYLHMVEPGDDGDLHLPPTFSPGPSKMQDQCKMGIETGTRDVILYTE